MKATTEPRADHGDEIVVVDRPEDLCTAAMDRPLDLIVLREPRPPSPERLCEYAAALGGVLEAPGFGPVRSVKYDPTTARATALSLQALSMHTDGSFLDVPPTRFMLSCVQADPGGGGVSTFVRVSDILAAAPDWVLGALHDAEYLFLQTYDSDLTGSCVAPVLSCDARGQSRIRWRADHVYRPRVVRSRGTKADEAALWLQEHLESCGRLAYLARAGETLLVPNTLMVHGRTPLSPGSLRELSRVWVV